MKTLITKTEFDHGEALRLGVYLRGWNALNELFQVEEIPNTTLDKLMTLEKAGKNRGPILERLSARYGRNVVRELRTKTLGLRPPTKPRKKARR